MFTIAPELNVSTGSLLRWLSTRYQYAGAQTTEAAARHRSMARCDRTVVSTGGLARVRAGEHRRRSPGVLARVDVVELQARLAGSDDVAGALRFGQFGQHLYARLAGDSRALRVL